ncbi:hypothetical protein HK097_001306 [Rhizophlyctis rosea]|uniref:Hyaluronan-mediated motility receptor C-terminal domain-containing protein n=1 Tax=Rhizophlyctis rosea TaxID=64517 RepID=A0AAD5S6A9_9FUNG|nr:hypothetical protein HK097_001306 [Rhizophlyctis rosea]
MRSLLGHANQNQKIERVAQLKEENLNLKKENMAMTRQIQDASRRIVNLEGKLESIRAFHPFPPIHGPSR